MRASYYQTVCSVTVVDPTDPREESDSGFDIDSPSNSFGRVVAAHTAGGDGSEALGIPKMITQMISSEDSEFWKAAILDELSNHEEVFQFLGPPIPKEPGIKATLRDSCFLKSWLVSTKGSKTPSRWPISSCRIHLTMKDSEQGYYMHM